MKSIKEVIKTNKLLEDKEKQLNNELKEIKILRKKINNEIDLDEISTLNYAEIKELFNNIKYYLSDDIRSEISKIMDIVKIKENPKLEDVHYFPILNEISCIPEALKKQIDTDLRKASIRGGRNDVLLKLLDKYKNKFDFYEELENELIEKKVIEPLYVFICKECGDEYDNDIIEAEKFESMKAYWEKSSNGIETTKEEDDKCNYGYIEIGLECDSYEIGSLEEFWENLSSTEYRMIMSPDLTLEKL